MQTITKILCAVTTLTTIHAAQAGTEVINIQMNDHEQKASTIALKQEIKKSPYSYLNLNDYKISSVLLVAKSKHGGAQASLAIGSWTSQPQRIYGNPQHFKVPGHFDRLTFTNYSSNPQGVWQLKLNGNIKIKNVVIRLETKDIDRGKASEQIQCGLHNVSQKDRCLAQRPITNIRLVLDSSRGRGYCQKHETFGFQGRTLWTSNGCKGTFQISYGGRNRGR